MTAAAPKTNAILEEDESSSSASSDWDDWKDPQYIEEQRKALQDFSKVQRDIKSSHSKKKKKKSKKKKNRGPTGGDALDDDLESEFRSNNDLASEYNTKSKLMDHEEEKVPNISKTRIGDIDKSSILQNSNFDNGSLGDGNQEFEDLIMMDGKKDGSRNQMQFSTQPVKQGHVRDNSFKEIAGGIDNRMPYLDSQESAQKGSAGDLSDSQKKLINQNGDIEMSQPQNLS